MLNDAAVLAIARKTEVFYSSKTTKTFVLIAFLLIYKRAYNELAAANQIKSWYQYLTTVATVTQTAETCWIQLVHVKRSTVTNADIGWKSTATLGPMETHFAFDSAFAHFRMPSIKPTWRMRTAPMFRDTWLRHLLAGTPLEPVPALSQRYVAFSDSYVALWAVKRIQSHVERTF